MEVYIYIIILIVLLFIALTAIIVYIMCRRKLLEKPMRQPLVGTTDFSPYEMKWQMAGGPVYKSDKHDDGPPPYNVAAEEKKQPPADDMVTFQHVQPSRVTVHDDDDYLEPVDEENPNYSTVTESRGPAVSAEVKTDEYKPEDEEGAPSYTNPVFESEQESVHTDVTLKSPSSDDAITVMFTEGEGANTVAAHVTTPDANLTINLNISLPDGTVKTIEATG